MWQAIIVVVVIVAVLALLWIDRRRQMAIMRADNKVEEAERRADAVQAQLDAEVETRKRELSLKFGETILAEERLERAVAAIDKLLRALHVCAAQMEDERGRILAVEYKDLLEYVNNRKPLPPEARWLL